MRCQNAELRYSSARLALQYPVYDMFEKPFKLILSVGNLLQHLV